ncbi:cytochrome P450 [Corynespora cassiicola Philippines]|uniref:Cytochrome P450 n=1 Tax=Corynespora cassiicola Philippines TaxID=1448308 RepID=A0A2T2NYU7_CORCC|nr:cytochrome P450 [Corynespora cassiicola Philippines]
MNFTSNLSAAFQTHDVLPNVEIALKRPIIPGLLVSLLLLYCVSVCTYRLRFHALAKYPGPPLAAMSIKPFEYHYLKGDWVQWMHELHEKYGEVVRYGPNFLSYTNPQAWKDIYGHRSSTKRLANGKNPIFKQDKIDGHDSVLGTVDEAEHGRQRRIFSHAFSDRALADQESLIRKYIDKFIHSIRQKIAEDPDKKAAINIVRYFNWTTFDIIGDLTFGENLGHLDQGKNSAWIDLMFSNFRFVQLLNVVRHYRLLFWLIQTCMPKSVLEEAATHTRNSCESVTRRLARKEARPDIWGIVLKREGADRMPRGQMDANSFLFMIAGSETTATLLSGVTWLLMKNPDKYEKLKAEVRSVNSESELTAGRVRQMKYLVAVVEEGLRWYPPVPAGLMRDIAKGGNRVLDDILPEGVATSVPSYPVSHSALNFLDPEAFIPERWMLEETDYKEYHEYDKREAVQPFSFGPRNCLGKNLAYYEMRAILAVLVYNFDLELDSECDAWGIGQKNWHLWDKPPLMMRVAERK